VREPGARRPVFDTNILFSSIRWRGAPHRCVELARTGAVEGITCAEILDELEENLRAKLDFGRSTARIVVADFLSFLRVVSIPGTLRVIESDPDDNVVLECAVAGDATHIVTGDRRHLLPLVSYGGVAIVTATDFLAEMGASDL
jgi:uncharacterized protein